MTELYGSGEMVNGKKERMDGDVIRLANEEFIFEIKEEFIKV